jgi:hypothetical protein
MSRGLLALPREICQVVLDHLSEHEPSLRAFACVSQFCHVLSLPHLYHTLEITVNRTQHLRPLVQQTVQKLQRHASFRHVRCLVVNGELTEDDRTQLDIRHHDPPISLPNRYPADNLQGYLSPYDKPYYECGSASESPQVAYETNDAWRPLADLVQQLSSLSDLVFVCPRQFPICLLETIH